LIGYFNHQLTVAVQTSFSRETLVLPNGKLIKPSSDMVLYSKSAYYLIADLAPTLNCIKRIYTATTLSGSISTKY